MKSTLKYFSIAFFVLHSFTVTAQVKWINVDADFQPLPEGFHVYSTHDSLNGSPFIAYYAEAVLKNKSLDFTADTVRDRRLTPKQFYERDNKPLLLVNCSFFSYETNRSLNTVIKEGKLIGFNHHTIPMKGKDTFQYKHPFFGAIGIDKKRNADVVWVYNDSATKKVLYSETAFSAVKDSDLVINFKKIRAQFLQSNKTEFPFTKWKVQTAVGGGPVLLQNGQVKISNNEELKFNGKAIDDKHPRTCIGYTKDGRLIVMVITGRYKGIAEGASLTQEAQLLKDLGCEEALNLDGGGSSCMLINGKETIKPSEKGEERPVPAVFMIVDNKNN
ncbi:MAG: phosphodiester glycosidase family protein [Ferruginibacter sp.]